MSTPYYVILSDSEDDYPPHTPTAPDADSSVDMDISSTLGSPVIPYDGYDGFESEHTATIIYLSDTDSDDEMYTHTAVLGTPSVQYDGFIPEDEPSVLTPTAEPTTHGTPTLRADSGYTPTPEGFVYPETEEEEEEEDPSEDDSDTASSDTFTTPPATIPAMEPHRYIHAHISGGGGPRTRLTARKSVPILPPAPHRYHPYVVARRTAPTPDSTVVRRDYRDVHVVTTTPTTTPIPTTTTTPITTPIPTTTTPLQDYSSQYRDWMHATLQTWRHAERIPSTYEIGESSNAPVSTPVSTILVARVARLEREQRMLEQDFGSYTSLNTANIRQSFDAVREDAVLADQAASATHARVMHTRGDIATLQTRVESSERRIAELEGLVRALTRGRPSHP